MKNNSALFYTCSLIEFIGRAQKQKRSAVVELLGRDTILRIYQFADVFHCEPIEKTADDFITLRQIPLGSFDNVADCRYAVPDYWTIGEVYERLIEDVVQRDDDQAVVGSPCAGHPVRSVSGQPPGSGEGCRRPCPACRR